MGSVMSGMKDTMEENRKKSQEFMLESQRNQTERQIHMQMMMREKMVAAQLAGARDLVHWFGGFYATASVAMIAGFMKTKNPAALAAFVPLSFILGYQLDMAYGNKIERIAAEADQILQNEQHLLRVPGIPVNFDTIEKARMKSAKS